MASSPEPTPAEKAIPPVAFGIAAAAILAVSLSLGGPATPPAGGATAFDPARMTDSQRSAFGEAVRGYLLENPGVLMEAISVLEQRQQQDQVTADLAMLRDNAAEIFEDPASWSGGNPEGDITVVEFVDYRCGYCRKAHDEVQALVEGDGNIRLVMKEFPILGEASLVSSRLAVAILQKAGPEAYKVAHDALIALQGPLDAAAIAAIAAEAGADPAAIIAHMQSDSVSKVIAANQALAQRLQINGTPTFVIHETMVRGYVPLDGMQSIVAGQRRKLQ